MKAEAETPLISTLVLDRAHQQAMLEHVQKQAPEEACGLLGGQRAGARARVALVIPITNALHSATRYRMEPQEQLAAFNRLDAAGLELLAIYHSHPKGPATPSATDLAEAYYPEAVHLIWSAQEGRWECRGYRLSNGRFQPVELEISA